MLFFLEEIQTQISDIYGQKDRIFFFLHKGIKNLFSEENKVWRWQGPPHVNKVKCAVL